MGRGAGEDPIDPRDVGGDDRHRRRRDERVASARDVTARRLDREHALAHRDPRLELPLETGEVLALLHVEGTDVLDRVVDAAPLALAKIVACGGVLVVADAHILTLHVVEPGGELVDGIVPPRLNLG
ncbi:MAG: hypothetical protein RI560_03350 [Natronomonas sp.]|nr:hypothetical protein [Natronomonas sp.]